MNEQDVLMQDIFHPASSRNHAVLLLHGLRSTPQEMGYLARALAKQGFAVHAPYLDGYGLGTRCTTSVEWREQVRAHYQKLTSAYGSVSVGGLCIGATLALALAVEEPELLALSLLSVTVARYVPLAALGLAVIMLLAVGFHLKRKESPGPALVLLILAGFVAVGRGLG